MNARLRLSGLTYTLVFVLLSGAGFAPLVASGQPAAFTPVPPDA